MLVTAEDGRELHSADAWPLPDHDAGGLVLSYLSSLANFQSLRCRQKAHGFIHFVWVSPICRISLESVVCMSSRPVWFWLVKSDFSWTNLAYSV